MSSPRMSANCDECCSPEAAATAAVTRPPSSNCFVDVELDTCSDASTAFQDEREHPTTPNKAVSSGPGGTKGLPAPVLLGRESALGIAAGGSSPPLPVVPMPVVKRTADQRDFLLTRRMSATSFALFLVISLLCLGTGFECEETMLMGLGMMALMASATTLAVLCYFRHPAKLAQEWEIEFRGSRRYLRYERSATMSLGTIFVGIGVLLLFAAVMKLMTQSEDVSSPEDYAEANSRALLCGLISWPCLVVFSLFASVKHRLAKSLTSEVLQRDALCSAVAASLSLICGIAALIQEASDGTERPVATVDAIASGAIAVVLMTEGVRTVRDSVTWIEQFPLRS